MQDRRMSWDDVEGEGRCGGEGFAACVTRQPMYDHDIAATTCEEGAHSVDRIETEGGRGRGSSLARDGLLFDKEATTLFYNCVFNLMDSLMRFAVLSPAARKVHERRKSARERGRKTEFSLAYSCMYARSQYERG